VPELLIEKLLHSFHGDFASGGRPGKQVGVSDPAEDEFSNALGDWTTPFVLRTTGIVTNMGGASIAARNLASTVGTAVAIAPA
jgi:hypothetical protein